MVVEKEETELVGFPYEVGLGTGCEEACGETRCQVVAFFFFFTIVGVPSSRLFFRTKEDKEREGEE